MNTVEAYRFGEAQPTVWRVWVIDPVHWPDGRWEEVHGLGEQTLRSGERVIVVERGRWHQAMSPGPAPLTGELKLVRGGG
jgi:hypothetical protein